MAPTINVSNEVLEGLDKLGVSYTPVKGSNSRNPSDFIYVPSINLYVARERTLRGKNWFESHKELQNNEERMLTIPEFIEFLKYIKENHEDIYNDITEVRAPVRAEWLDADFKMKNGNLYINSNHVYQNGILVPQTSEILRANTLMKNKTPGISLEDWLENPTRQGLPSKKTKSGDLYYRHPMNDNSSIAKFDADSYSVYLSCNKYPFYGGQDLGVRAAHPEK